MSGLRISQIILGGLPTASSLTRHVIIKMLCQDFSANFLPARSKSRSQKCDDDWEYWEKELSNIPVRNAMSSDMTSASHRLDLLFCLPFLASLSNVMEAYAPHVSLSLRRRLS